nr:hypothetical protein [Brevundimonas subvibrioides]
MLRCLVRLHEGPGTPPNVEDVDAVDDCDARDLALMRLRLTRGYTCARICRRD